MSIEQDCRETVVFALMKAKAWTKPQAEEYVKLWLDHHPDNAARSQPAGVTMEMVNTLIASVNEAHLSKIEDWRTACWESADRILERIQEAIASAQQPATGEPVMDVRCEGCGYMTHHREHMGCVRAAKQHTHPAPSVFLVRDVASLLGASVPDVCNALAELGYEPRRSTNAAISPDEAIAVAKRINPAPSVPDDVVRDAERFRRLNLTEEAIAVVDSMLARTERQP